jgi:post-segregation antitoxin (ccd killing protein)
MSKRRVTLTLDEDIIEALQRQHARSLSAAANSALRQAIESDNHREAARKWLAELDAMYGTATPHEQADNEAFLDAVGFGRSRDDSAGTA